MKEYDGGKTEGSEVWGLTTTSAYVYTGNLISRTLGEDKSTLFFLIFHSVPHKLRKMGAIL